MRLDDNTEYISDLLQRINNCRIGETTVAEYFNQGASSLWTFQQFYISEQIKKFSNSSLVNDEARLTKKKRTLTRRLLSATAMAFLFFISCIALTKFFIKQPKVIVFSSDFLKTGTRMNARLHNVYELFEERNIDFFEVIHVYDFKKAVPNLFKRRKTVFYLEAINSLFVLFCGRKKREELNNLIDDIDYTPFTTEEQKFVRSLFVQVSENIRISKFKISFLTWVLKKGGVHNFISIDDVRYANEFLVACQATGVKTCWFQHSNFDYLNGLDTLSPTHYVFPDIFFVWNSYWKERISKLSPLYDHYKNRLSIGGRAYSYSTPDCIEIGTDVRKNEIVSVLIPYEVNLTPEQVRPYIHAMTTTEKIHIFFLPRGDFDAKSQVEKYFGDINILKEKVTILELTQKQEVLKTVDVVLGVYSGFLDEAIESCKPVGILETSYQIFNKLQDDNMASLVQLGSDRDLYEQICQIRDVPSHLLKVRRKRFIDGVGNPKEAVLEFLAK